MFQTPFTPGFSTPSTEGSGVTSRGGADLGEGSQKETANLSDIPLQPDTYTVGPGDPGKGGTVPLADIGTSRTIKTSRD
jgi:hypothetical protein